MDFLGIIDFVKIFEQLGIPVGGLCVITYLLLQDRKLTATERQSHRAERAEWRESHERIEERSAVAFDLLRESNENIQNRNLEAINDLKLTNISVQEKNIKALEELASAIRSSKDEKR